MAIRIRIYHVFIDFKKTFDRVWHASLLATMKKYNIIHDLVCSIKGQYRYATSAFFNNETIGSGSRQVLE